MGRNLHISYDLFNPGQNYEKVIDRIKTLGSWAKIHQSYWYVDSTLTAAEARDQVWAVMDANDSLYVADASNNEAAWQNLSEKVSDFIQDKWHK